MFKVLSLFDGVSVAQQALKELGVKDLTYYASEIDKYAIAITKKNFPNTIELGSVVGLKVNFQPDLMILGSPCQDLSIAKKDRKGLDGERSGLFWEAIRIHKEVKPKWFVYENVSSMKKEWKEQMLKAIQEIEPRAYMIEINAALVSAQNRKRVFFTNIPNIKQPEDKGILLRDILQPDAEVDERMVVNGKSFSLTASYNGAVEWNSVERKQRTMVRAGQLNKGGQGDRIYNPDGKSVNLSANGGGRGAKTGLYAVKGVVRKLTPVECERLQSLPDFFTEKGINEKGEEITISNSQRYKALGNAFNCEVIKHILKNIC